MVTACPARASSERLPQTDDAGAADGDRLTAAMVGRSIPERHAFAAWVGAAFEAVWRHRDDVRVPLVRSERSTSWPRLSQCVGEVVPVGAGLDHERIRRSSRN